MSFEGKEAELKPGLTVHPIPPLKSEFGVRNDTTAATNNAAVARQESEMDAAFVDVSIVSQCELIPT